MRSCMKIIQTGVGVNKQSSEPWQKNPMVPDDEGRNDGDSIYADLGQNGVMKTPLRL